MLPIFDEVLANNEEEGLGGLNNLAIPKGSTGQLDNALLKRYSTYPTVLPFARINRYSVTAAAACRLHR